MVEGGFVYICIVAIEEKIGMFFPSLLFIIFDGLSRENFLGEKFSRKPKIAFLARARLFPLPLKFFSCFEYSRPNPVRMYLGCE
jgi:hypothetical protein